jgi:acylphosphatase
VRYRATMLNIAKHLIISGRVQGVGFRNYIELKARQFHLTGWVRNRSDGSVEAMIHGTPDNVDALIVRAHRGPPQATVTSVTVSDGSGSYATFVTRPTE